MKRQWKKVMSGVLVAGFVTAGLLNGAAVHAANLDAAVTEKLLIRYFMSH